MADARALGRPIVFVQAALDASKVEGTEALLAMIRDLCLSTQKTLLEEILTRPRRGRECSVGVW